MDRRRCLRLKGQGAFYMDFIWIWIQKRLWIRECGRSFFLFNLIRSAAKTGSGLEESGF